MATQMIPIDPQKRDDLYYRYKMPAVVTKVEGSGNGIKTVIANIHDICLAINRPEEVLMKYFQFELGAQRTVSAKDDKFLLMGSHTAERMQDKIYDFIQKFVLCGHCRNPETAVELETNKKGTASISMVCGACGKRTKFSDHRVLFTMTQYYLKHPEEAKAAKGAAEARKNKDAEPTDAAATAAPVKQARVIADSDLADNRENPTLVLARAMKECGDHTDELISRLVRLLSQYNLVESYGPALLLSAVLCDHEKDLLATIRRYAVLFRRFATVPELYSRDDTHEERELTEFYKREKTIQRTFLKECERICAEKYTADRMAALVFLLFIEGIVRDTNIASWAKDPKPLKSIGNPALDAEMKSKVMHIVDWLGLGASTAEAAE